MKTIPITSSYYPPPYDFLVNSHHCYSQKLYINNQFNNSLWRWILSQVSTSITKDLQVISPFGFEVMQDKRFLKSPLRRFYCYIGIPAHCHVAHDHILAEFNHMLFDLLKKRYPDFYQKIVLKVVQDQFIKLKNETYQCELDDKLIDIQLRTFSISLLDDYADYIICSLPAIYHGQDEPKEFLVNARFRNRTYQLYLMLEHVFGSYINNMTDDQVALFKKSYKKINNAIDIFYNDQALYTLANDEDKVILNELILKRTHDMITALNDANDVITITSRSYHVNDKLHFTLSKTIYDSAKQFIINTYNNYY